MEAAWDSFRNIQHPDEECDEDRAEGAISGAVKRCGLSLVAFHAISNGGKS